MWFRGGTVLICYLRSFYQVDGTVVGRKQVSFVTCQYIQTKFGSVHRILCFCTNSTKVLFQMQPMIHEISMFCIGISYSTEIVIFKTAKFLQDCKVEGSIEVIVHGLLCFSIFYFIMELHPLLWEIFSFVPNFNFRSTS